MNKSAKRTEGKKAADGEQLWLRLSGMVREALYDTVMVTGLACVDEVLEAERAGLCGARYAHQAERQALRAGHVPSSLVLGGRRVAVSRPRVRSVEGRELKLPSWRRWGSMSAGISTSWGCAKGQPRTRRRLRPCSPTWSSADWIPMVRC